MSAVLGLDLSRRFAAAVAVPKAWAGDWKRVHSIVEGAVLELAATDEERISLIERIAQSIVAFARAHECTDAWIESYAFAQVTGAYTLGELGGVVRLELKRAGINIYRANIGTARKLLLGKIPRGKGLAKIAVVRTLQAAGARFETVDENEAMVCANFGLAHHKGAHFFASPEPPREARRRA